MWSRRRWWAVVAGVALAAPGCDQARALLEHPTTTASPTAVVVPSAAPTQILSLAVLGERELGPLARSLGTTIEDLVRDNEIAAGDALVDGQILRVRTRAPMLEAYLQARTERAEALERRRLEEIAAKRAEASERSKRRIRTSRGERKGKERGVNAKVNARVNAKVNASKRTSEHAGSAPSTSHKPSATTR